MKRLSLKTLLAAVVLSGVSFAAHAVAIVDNSTFGYYNNGLGQVLDTLGTNDPFPCANVACGDSTLTFLTAPNLSAAAGALGSWLGNSAPTGGAWSAAPQAIPSAWAINSESAIVYSIDAGTGLTDVNLSLGVDNGIFVWLNGSYLFGARAGGGSTLGEYSFGLSNLVGTNYLQILREDHGGAAGYDISLTANRVPVPAPAALGLFAMGLLALGARQLAKKTKN
ncbi:MAG TPA: hypothetical protein VK629_03255 [Steroidobacteraceae bacterium]|nr:hypothetical protein [Steroidobacteraceae bacterium]